MFGHSREYNNIFSMLKKRAKFQLQPRANKI